ncbi:PLDc N-terminal domain-containing protein [Bacillus pumilus]|uniref:PLDc N-terminal domain-containing protein n=1 Tax=Bacillus pumilus TaxID=1408 RepID=UPI003314637C
MELFEPRIGLILWVFFSLAVIGLDLFALIKLTVTSQIDTGSKWKWLIVIVLVPIFGAVVFLTQLKKLRTEKV